MCYIVRTVSYYTYLGNIVTIFLQGVPELSEHTLLHEYRHCGVTVEAAVTKLF